MSDSSSVTFLLSLPRSGSTAVQRSLALSPSIHTAAESWLLMPLLQPFRTEGVLADWDAGMQRTAQSAFLAKCEGGRDAYLRRLAEAVTGTWDSHLERGSATMYLEKVPRYALFGPLLAEAFPNARFIFLWRNPLEIVSSMIMTWSTGSAWPRSNLSVDLNAGMRGMLDLARQLDSDRAISIRYQDFVKDPNEAIQTVTTFLDVKPVECDLRVTGLPVIQSDADPGDPTHGRSAVAVGRQSDGLTSLRGGPRGLAIQSWLKSFSDSDLELMGENRTDLEAQLDSSDRVTFPQQLRDLVADRRSRVARYLMRNLTSGLYGTDPNAPATPR